MLLSEKHIYEIFEFIESSFVRELKDLSILRKQEGQFNLYRESINRLSIVYENQLLGLKYLFVDCPGKLKIIENKIRRIKVDCHERLNDLKEVA